MSLAEAFASYLEILLNVNIGQTLWIGEAPSSNKVADDIWWLIASGGGRETDNITGEAVKDYSIEIYCRSRNYKTVYTQLQDLEEDLNCRDCVQLEGYETISVKAQVLSIDDDLDGEDRKVGLLQANVKIYKEC